MPKGQHQYRVVPGFGAVKRDVAGATPRDDEFPQALFDCTANQRVIFKNGDGFANEPRSLRRRERFRFEQKISQPLQISQGTARINYLRQDFALGLALGLPLARAWTHA